MKPEIQINTNSPEDMRTSYKGSRIFSQKPQGTVRELNSKQVIAHTTSVSMDSNLQHGLNADNDVKVNLKNLYKQLPNESKVINTEIKEDFHGFYLEEALISVVCEEVDPGRNPAGVGEMHKQDDSSHENIRMRSKRKQPLAPENITNLLEDFYRANPAPSIRERHILAKKCGLSPIQVGYWFNNKSNKP